MTTIFVNDNNTVTVSDDYISGRDDVEIWFGNEMPSAYDNASDAELLEVLKFWVSVNWLPTPCRLNFKGRVVEISGEFHTLATHAHTGKTTAWADHLCGTRDFALSVMEFFADNDHYVNIDGRMYRDNDIRCFEDGEMFADPDDAVIDPAYPRDSYSIGDYTYSMEEATEQETPEPTDRKVLVRAFDQWSDPAC